MGDILYSQSMSVSAVKNVTPVTEKDFEIAPYETWSSSAMSESTGGRYMVPAATLDQAPGMGTVALGKVMVITPTSDIEIKFTNSSGVTPYLKFLGGRTSVLHMEFTAFTISNQGSVAVKGRFYVAGD